MSSRPRVRSRGASIIAALTLAALLTAVALAVQSTVPVTHFAVPTQTAVTQPAAVNAASQMAALMNTAIQSTGVETKNINQKDLGITKVCEVGEDYTIEVTKNTDGSAKLSQPAVRVICNKLISSPGTVGNHLSRNPSPNQTPACDTKKDEPINTTQNAQCQYERVGTTAQFKLVEPDWDCDTRVYDNHELIGDIKKCNVYKSKPGQDYIIQPTSVQAYFGNANINPEGIDIGSNVTNCDALCQVRANQELPASASLEDVLTEHTNNKEFYTAYCTDSGIDEQIPAGYSCPAIKKSIETNEAALQKMAFDNDQAALKACGNNDDAATCLMLSKPKQEATMIQDALRDDVSRVTTGGSGDSRCDTGYTWNTLFKQCIRTSGGTTGGTDRAGGGGGRGSGSGGGYYGTGAGGGYGTGGGYGGFGDPRTGYGSQIPSPFGGPCVQRYVCQGNMLYYQAPQSNHYSSMGGSCMTQPVQQCQYGCQQPYGQSGQQQSGAGGMLQGIGQGLQIASALSKIFGGGSNNNNSSMMNNNLPTSCAMTPQQGGQPSPHGNGNDGRGCQQPPQQPSQSQCTSGQWKPTSQSGNGCTTGWQCVPDGSGGGGGGGGGGTNPVNPSAQLSCQPQLVDIGMRVGFSFSCGNATASTGTGFNTNGAISGTSSATVAPPPAGQNKVTYTLTCVNQGRTASSQCQVEIARPSIIMVTNPQQVSASSTATIGWITTGMDSCVISSPDQSDFTRRNANIFSVNGTASTSAITMNSRFVLSCETLGGQMRSASTTVRVI